MRDKNSDFLRLWSGLFYLILLSFCLVGRLYVLIYIIYLIFSSFLDSSYNFVFNVPNVSDFQLQIVFSVLILHFFADFIRKKLGKKESVFSISGVVSEYKVAESNQLMLHDVSVDFRSQIISDVSDKKDDIRNYVSKRIDKIEARRLRQQILLDDEKNLTGKDLIPCIFQGGTNTDLSVGKGVLLSCRHDSFCLIDLENELKILLPFSELTELAIEGPGRQTSNIGLSGGGFGLESAVEGILIASVLNSFTSVSTINTFLTIGLKTSEALLLLKKTEPSELRVLLSPAFTSLNDKPKGQIEITLSNELEKIDDLRKKGVLTEDEFVRAKAKILNR